MQQDNILPLGNQNVNQSGDLHFPPQNGGSLFPQEERIDDTTNPQLGGLLGNVISSGAVEDYMLGEGYKKLQNFNRWFNMYNLKYYFAVNNSYVLNKLKLVLFPFRHKVFFCLHTFFFSSQFFY